MATWQGAKIGPHPTVQRSILRSNVKYAIKQSTSAQLGRGGRNPVAAREAPPRTAQPSVRFSQLVTVVDAVGPEPEVGPRPSVRFSKRVAVAEG